MKEILRSFWDNSKAFSYIAEKSTMNEDVFPIESGDFPDIALKNGWLEDISPIANGDFPREHVDFPNMFSGVVKL